MTELKFNEHGLLPAVIQDWLDGTVLMLGYMNEEALARTLATKSVHFWSRSRNKLWEKGETSGHRLSVKEVFIEGGVKIERELYFSVVMDRKNAGPTIIASAQGGMEIETLAEEKPEAIIRMPVDPNVGLRDFAARRLAFQLDIPATHTGEFVKTAKALVKAFIDLDCSMLEINPLILTPKGVAALDCKMSTDDNGAYRQHELAKYPDHEASALEKEAKKHDISYVGLEDRKSVV